MAMVKKINHFKTKIFLLSLSFLLVFSLPNFSQTPDSTRQLIIEKIEIEGNTKTRPNVIFRHLTLSAGEALIPAQIIADNLRLFRTNFFKKIDIYTRPGSQKGLVVVVIEVQERKWPYFRFEGGRSDLDGWYISPFNMRFDNFFGKGNFTGWQIRISDLSVKFSLNGRNPNLFNSSVFLEGEVFLLNQDFIHFVDGEQIIEPVDSDGFVFRIGGTKGLSKFIFFSYKNQNYRPFFNERLFAFFPDDFRETRISALSLGLRADLRDNPLYPLIGFWGALSWEVTDDAIGSDGNFSKIVFDARVYKRIHGRKVFAIGVKGGYTSGEAPFFERFYLGGVNSLRGYADRSLTPIGLGTKFVLTQTEIRIPLSKKNFPNHTHTAALYFDSGGIWVPGQKPSIDDFYSTVGFGYRVKLPIVGITRLDFSFPLNKNELNDEDFRLTVGLGHTF